MNSNDLEKLFKEIAHELKNPINKGATKNYKDVFDYEDFQSTINNYIQYANALVKADDELLSNIIKYSNEILQYTVDGSISTYIKKFLSAAIFLNDHDPSSYPEFYIGTLENETKVVPQNEFSRRYDKLVALLNDHNTNKSNLILETKESKTPFKLFKNSNNSIVVKAGQEKAPMSVSKNALIQVLYEKKIPTYKSYEEVIIAKLIDNSIFDLIGDSSPYGFDFNSDEKFKNLEEERLKTVGKIKEIEDKLNSQVEKNEALNILLQNSQSAETSFNNAKEAILKDIELQKSYKFWESKQRRYFRNYIGYLMLSIVLVGLMLWKVSIFLENNPLTLDIKNSQQEITVGIGADISIDAHDSNVSKNKLASSIKRIQLWEYGFLIFTTTLVLWFIKILVKITLSNYHLSIDADERVIMIRTYLSLLKEGSGFDEKDKKVMLDNIFRPTNFGIIKDESSVTITDIISSFRK